MKRKLVFILMLLILAPAITGAVLAQEQKTEKKHKHKHRHKKNRDAEQPAEQPQEKPLSKKEERRLKKEQKRKEKQERRKQKRERRKNRKKAVVMKQAPEEPTTQPADEYPLTQLKNSYRVDILAPMYLDDLVKGEAVTYKNKMPEKAEQGLAFYEGVRIAADSLKNAGYNIDIYVYDITTDKESVHKLLADNKFDSTDLIIGDVFPQDIAPLADRAKKNKINFVSAIAASDGGIKSNPYFTMLHPTIKSHCEWVTGKIALTYPAMNVGLLYRTNNPADEAAYNYITAYPYNIHFRQLSCNILPSKEMLALMFDTSKPNVVVIPVTDPGYADSLLTALTKYFPNTHFEVYGMPSWNSIGSLRKENAFPNLTVNVTYSFHVDPASASYKYVSHIYKANYGSKVPEMVFHGYETMFWYANLLKKYGTIFNVKYEDNTSAPFSSFDVQAVRDSKGNIVRYENKHVFIARYEAGNVKTE